MPTLLTPEVVFDLSDDEIRRIASESSDSADERAVVMEKLTVLEGGMIELKQLKKYHTVTSDLQVSSHSQITPLHN